MIDTEIILRCQNDDPAAYDELYKAFGKKALWTAYLLAGRMSIAEDIVQEAFFQCFRNIKRLKKPELFHIWFNRILIRTCWHMMKREMKKTVVPPEAEFLSELNGNGDMNLHEKVESNQINSVIRKAVKRLKPSMRSTIVLFYYNDFTISEIARVTGCLQGTVKSRLHYAKRILEKELKKHFSDKHITVPGFPGKECLENE